MSGGVNIIFWSSPVLIGLQIWEKRLKNIFPRFFIFDFWVFCSLSKGENFLVEKNTNFFCSGRRLTRKSKLKKSSRGKCHRIIFCVICVLHQLYHAKKTRKKVFWGVEIPRKMWSWSMFIFECFPKYFLHLKRSYFYKKVTMLLFGYLLWTNLY